MVARKLPISSGSSDVKNVVKPMQKQKPKPSVFEKVIVWEEALKEVENHIQQDADAKNALVTLAKKGCDRKSILKQVYLYAGGAPADAAEVKKQFAFRRKFVANVGQELGSLVPKLERVGTYLSDAGLEVTWPVSGEELSSLAEFMKGIADRYLKHLASRRVSGRDHNLVSLVETVDKITGREHYQELAEIVDSVRTAYRPSSRPLGAGDVRDVVRRYRRSWKPRRRPERVEKRSKG